MKNSSGDIYELYAWPYFYPSSQAWEASRVGRPGKKLDSKQRRADFESLYYFLIL
jgi:hypothetical protein